MYLNETYNNPKVRRGKHLPDAFPIQHVECMREMRNEYTNVWHCIYCPYLYLFEGKQFHVPSTDKINMIKGNTRKTQI
jgi:hypothetical protein